jgi:hypothetical protein
MTDQTQASGGGSFYHVPATVEDMKPPSPSSLITEAANFLRAHWDEVKPYYQSMSGETASIHGSFPLDEAACVFKIQQIASANGYAYLGTLQAAKLRRAFRFGFKRNTGERAIMRRLAIQHRQRRIEDQRQQDQP